MDKHTTIKLMIVDCDSPSLNPCAKYNKDTITDLVASGGAILWNYKGLPRVITYSMLQNHLRDGRAIDVASCASITREDERLLRDQEYHQPSDYR